MRIYLSHAGNILPRLSTEGAVFKYFGALATAGRREATVSYLGGSTTEILTETKAGDFEVSLCRTLWC